MLYDPKWEKTTETKADPLTLDALIAWLETKPAAKTYCYDDHGHCLAAQYNASIGREYSVIPVGHRATVHDEFDYQLEFIAVWPNEHTFGNALKVARGVRDGIDID